MSGYVQDGHVAEQLLVTAHGREGTTQFLVPASAEGISVTPLDALDLGRRLSEVRFDAVVADAASVVGTIGGAAPDVERQFQLALVLQCAETIGLVERVFELTVEYSKDRVAFGRPIGSFQALKHRLADHAMWLEAARRSPTTPPAPCTPMRSTPRSRPASPRATWVDRRPRSPGTACRSMAASA